MSLTHLRDQFDFTDFRHPEIAEGDHRGPRAIINGRFKLVVHEQKSGGERRELFDLAADPAERNNLFDQQTVRADELDAKLRDWQNSVLHSLTGADYRP